MINVILHFILLIIQMIILLLIMRTGKKDGPLFLGIKAGIIGYYVLIPLVVLAVYLLGNDDIRMQMMSKSMLSGIIQADLFDVIIMNLVTMLCCVCLVYAYRKRVGFTRRGNVPNRYERQVNKHALSRLKLVGDICLYVGSACTLYYILSFGSFSRAFRLAGYIRGLNIDAKEYVGYFASLMIIPGGAVVLAPWCYLLVGSIKDGFFNKLKLMIGFVIGMLFLFVRAGRAPLLVYVASFVMPLLMRRMKHPWGVLVFGAILCMPILDFLDVLFDGGVAIGTGYNFLSYLAQFAYPYRTMVNALDIVGEFGLRFGQDFITPFLGLLPGLNFDAPWRIVSEFFGGAAWETKGSIPTDFITFLVMQFHFLGIFLGYPIGKLISKIDIAMSAYEITYSTQAVYAFIVLSGFWFVSTADFESLVRNIYFMGLCCILIFTTRNSRKLKQIRLSKGCS